MSDLKQQIEKIANDLTHLEINTIVKKEMSAVKMPSPRHALIDICYDYGKKLIEIRDTLTCCSDILGSPDSLKGIDIDSHEVAYTVTVENFRLKAVNTATGQQCLPGSFCYFDMLRIKAERMLNSMQEKTAGRSNKEQDYIEKTVPILYRIKDQSNQIKGVFGGLRYRIDNKEVGEKVQNAMRINGENRTPGGLADNNYTRQEIEQYRPPFPLTPDDLVTLRKAWELETEEIAFQTVIQLDGDVVTRVNPAYISEGQTVIRDIHSASVDASMKMWGQLVEVVKNFFESIVKVFFGSR